MKHTPYALLLAGFFWGIAPNAIAQISDDEVSTNFIALHCAVSGGGNVADYADYGRGLARTIGLLDSSQQERVFGFVPQPSDAAIPNYNPDLHGSLGTAGAVTGNDSSGTTNATTGATVTDSADTETAGNSAGETEPTGSTNPIVNAIDDFNDAMNGGDSGTEPIIGGTPPDPAETETDTAGTDSGGNWIDGILDWLRGTGQDEIADKVESDVDGAIDAGILDADGTINLDADGNVIDGDGNLVFPTSG